MNASRERLKQLTVFQQTLDDAWKGIRWTLDIITYGRDKSARGGIPLAILYSPPPSPDNSPDMYRKDLVRVASSASDLGYHSDMNSLTDDSWDTTKDTTNNNFLSPNYGRVSEHRERTHSGMSLD